MKYYSEQLDEMFSSEEDLKKAEDKYAKELAEANKIVSKYDEAVKFCQVTDKQISQLKDKLKEDIYKINKSRHEKFTEINKQADAQIKELQDTYNKKVQELYEACSKMYDDACNSWLDYVLGSNDN